MGERPKTISIEMHECTVRSWMHTADVMQEKYENQRRASQSLERHLKNCRGTNARLIDRIKELEEEIATLKGNQKNDPAEPA